MKIAKINNFSFNLSNSFLQREVPEERNTTHSIHLNDFTIL